MKHNYKIQDFKFRHVIKTRYRDLDSFNHINNATFLSYFEDARILFFDRWNVNKNDRSLIVASINIDYIKQVKHPSDLIVCQKISRIGTKSFDNHSVIFCNDELVCVSKTTIVCYNFVLNKSVQVYDEIKQDLNL